MKQMKKLSTVALATSMVLGGMTAVPSLASAEMSADITISNMYLWRGQNVAPDGATVSGTLSYSHDSGAYAGVWTTSEQGGHEYDLFVGYGGEYAGISYDVSYWYIAYPEDGAPNTDLSDNNVNESALSLGYADFSFGVVFGNVGNETNDYKYYTLGYDIGKFSLMYGMQSYTTDASGNDYSHYGVSYAATDELSFTVSMLSNEGDYPDKASGAYETDPLIQVSYTKSFDL